MWDMNEVTAIEYRRGLVYWVQFDDGTNGEIDFAGYPKKGTVFERLANAEFFRSARIEGGTISWPNGADVAPEALYEKIERAKAA